MVGIISWVTFFHLVPWWAGMLCSMVGGNVINFLVSIWTISNKFYAVQSFYLIKSICIILSTIIYKQAYHVIILDYLFSVLFHLWEDTIKLVEQPINQLSTAHSSHMINNQHVVCGSKVTKTPTNNLMVESLYVHSSLIWWNNQMWQNPTLQYMFLF